MEILEIIVEYLYFWNSATDFFFFSRMFGNVFVIRKRQKNFNL